MVARDPFRQRKGAPLKEMRLPRFECAYQKPLDLKLGHRVMRRPIDTLADWPQLLGHPRLSARLIALLSGPAGLAALLRHGCHLLRVAGGNTSHWQCDHIRIGNIFIFRRLSMGGRKFLGGGCLGNPDSHGDECKSDAELEDCPAIRPCPACS